MKNHFFLSSVVVVFPVVVMLTGCGEDASDVAFKEPLPDVVDFNSVSYTHLTLPTKRIV